MREIRMIKRFVLEKLNAGYLVRAMYFEINSYNNMNIHKSVPYVTMQFCLIECCSVK